MRVCFPRSRVRRERRRMAAFACTRTAKRARKAHPHAARRASLTPAAPPTVECCAARTPGRTAVRAFLRRSSGRSRAGERDTTGGRSRSTSRAPQEGPHRIAALLAIACPRRHRPVGAIGGRTATELTFQQPSSAGHQRAFRTGERPRWPGGLGPFVGGGCASTAARCAASSASISAPRAPSIVRSPLRSADHRIERRSACRLRGARERDAALGVAGQALPARTTPRVSRRMVQRPSPSVDGGGIERPVRLTAGDQARRRRSAATRRPPRH